MIAKNCSIEDLKKALEIINTERYQDNIEFREIEQKTKNSIRFTLKCKSIEKPGHRVHYQIQEPFTNPHYKTKRSSNSCWHVHGDFFDALFSINPDAKIKSGSLHHEGVNKGWITKDEGNWIDTDIGSPMFPFYFSESCDCNDVISPIKALTI